MKRFIAVDSGKFTTKLATYNPKTTTITTYKFRTKTGEGSFEDDALEANTLIAEIDGKVYKVGNGALQPAELATSKQSETHKICTLVAIAMCASNDEVDEINVAIGAPVKDWEVVERRNSYKKYMLPEGEITVMLKTKSDEPAVKKTFKSVNRYVYPESSGALYLDKIAEFGDNTVAVIDIGNLNINCTLWNNAELDRESSLTDELGGNILITGLAQTLSAELGMRCSESLVARLLTLPKEERYLVPKSNDNSDIPKRSKQIIDKYLLEHVKQIRRKCDAKQWSLDFMQLAFIGGTSQILANEIKEVFGDHVYIPDNPEYANVNGFLRLLCAKTLNMVIPLQHKEEKSAVKAEKSA